MYRPCNILATHILLLLLSSVVLSQNLKGILKGFVSDRKTTLKLQDASIIISGTTKGTTTNIKGYFEFTLPEGQYSVEARMLGYEPLVKECDIVPDEKTSLFFELNSIDLKIGEVNVTGSRDQDVETMSYELLPGDLKNIPQFGEADPLRALFALPGVNTINNLSNQLYVRGGNFDETLIALDNVPLYNPYHLGSVFSSINSDIIKKEKLWLSNYSQSAGGYLSGLLELTPKKGNSDQLNLSASLGLISSRLLLEGPLWNGTFITSIRRTYFDALTTIMDEPFPYYFYDGYFNYSLPVSSKDIFEISAFYSRDALKLGFSGSYRGQFVIPKWGNMLFNSRWTHYFDDKTSIGLQAYLSSAYMKSDEFKDAAEFDNLIEDKTLRLEYKDTGNRNYLNIGIEYKFQKLDYNWLIGDIQDLRDYLNPPEEAFFDYAPNPFSFLDDEQTLTSFAVERINLSDKILINLGLRGSYLSSFNGFFPSASAGLSYKAEDNICLRFNMGRYYQYMYTLKEKRPESIYSPFSVPFLSTGKDNVARSDNFSFGMNITKLPLELEFDIEGFYNLRHNLAGTYYDYPRCRFEDGYSSGFDLMIKKDQGLLTGWIGYTFGRSVKKNEEYYYYTVYDRRHTFKILLSYPLSEKWKLSAFWTYASGTPYTDIEGRYVGGEDFRSTSGFNYPSFSWRAIDGRKNSSRIDNHHRLDIGLSGSFIWGSFLISPYLQVLNVYNNSNNIILNNSLHNIYDERLIYPSTFVIPTLGVTVEF